MKSPWSVKGVSREDRAQAKMAARRAGLPVGVWLSQQIRASGPEEGLNTEGVFVSPSPTESQATEPSRRMMSRAGPDSRFMFGPGQWSTATDAIDGGQVSQPPPQAWPGGRPPVMPAPLVQPQMAPGQKMASVHSGAPMVSHWGMPPMAHPMYGHQMPPQAPEQAPAPKVDLEAFKAMELQIESLQKRLTAAEAREAKETGAVDARLSQIDVLARDVDALRVGAQKDSKPNYSMAPVERAVMRLSERLQKIEDSILPPESSGGFFSRLFMGR